eukprot:RCo042616
MARDVARVRGPHYASTPTFSPTGAFGGGTKAPPVKEEPELDFDLKFGLENQRHTEETYVPLEEWNVATSPVDIPEDCPEHSQSPSSVSTTSMLVNDYEDFDDDPVVPETGSVSSDESFER